MNIYIYLSLALFSGTELQCLPIRHPLSTASHAATASQKPPIGVKSNSEPLHTRGAHIKKETLETHSMNEQEAHIYIQASITALETVLCEYATPAEIIVLTRTIHQNIQQSPSVLMITDTGTVYDKRTIDLCIQNAMLNFIQYVSYTKVLAHTCSDSHAKSTALAMRNNALTHIRMNGFLDPKTLIPIIYRALP